MNGIKVLPPGLQNQIAAGEVVERPASVVKELMENSLDAGARTLKVYLESGGQGLIEVMDDGLGLEPHELPLALTRHATSKISSMEELAGVISFGFRGEALPSIASISQMTICSCPGDRVEGFCLKLLYGQNIDQGPVAMTRGTRVRVENLLANVPARLKFLKTRATESKKCVESFLRPCFVHLDADFELFSESRSLYRFFPGQTLLERIRAIWPAQVSEALNEFSIEQGEMKVHGLASTPDSTQGRADRLLFYVNNRPVSDRMLLSAVRQAYSGRLLSREYPQAVIFIDLPPEEVDVNVHPAKNEVRFRSEKEIFSLVSRAIRSCIDTGVHVSMAPREEDPGEISEEGGPEEFSYQWASQEKTFKRLREKHSGFGSRPGLSLEPGPETSLDDNKKAYYIRDLKYLGQIKKSYLLFLKADSSLLIVDQHAAHERIMLERIRRGFQKTVVKRLAVPEKLSLHPSELSVLQNIWKDLKKMGFILEISSSDALLVSGIPGFMSPAQAVFSLRDILSQKKQDLEEIFIAMACRTSIKSGTGLTPDEAVGLMDKLINCENHEFCPHGRPVVKEIGDRDLEKMFKR
jgi:DNA mismatch repair protein MutL